MHPVQQSSKFLTFVLLLSPLLATCHNAGPVPRDLEAVLVDEVPAAQPTAPSPQHQPSIATPPTPPQLQNLDLRQEETSKPRPRNLELRQNAVAANGNGNAAAANNAAVANNGQAAAAPAAAAPAAPAAPAAGVGGAGAAPAAAQPAPNAQANPVTTILVATVIGGVTTQVPVAFTQTFGAGASAPAVQSGSIGMGTLTGKVGVVKTEQAKKGNAPPAAGMGLRELRETLVVVGAGTVAFLVGGVWGIGLL